LVGHRPRASRSTTRVPRWRKICANSNVSTAVSDQIRCYCSDHFDHQVIFHSEKPQCSADNATCHIQSIVLNLDDTNQTAILTLTCTNFTTSADPGETCIFVQPVTDGTFLDIDECMVSYIPAGESYSIDCQCCSVCGINTATNVPEIFFDCCNAKTVSSKPVDPCRRCPKLRCPDLIRFPPTRQASASLSNPTSEPAVLGSARLGWWLSLFL
jgi:hypothetical protein